MHMSDMMLACEEMFLSVMIVYVFIQSYDDVCAHCLVGSNPWTSAISAVVPARLCRSDPNALVLSDSTQQLQSQVLELKETTEASMAQLSERVNKWSHEMDKLLLQMLKDIVNLDRNYLKLMPWCLQVHEKVTECMADKDKGGK